MGKYDDIIHLAHKQSSKRAHMSLHDRAAQFAPFAALTGYGEIVAETARQTDNKAELSEEQIYTLNARITLLKGKLSERPEVRITYFSADGKKSGGAYHELSGAVKKIDDYARVMEMESGDLIRIDDVCGIEILHEWSPLP